MKRYFYALIAIALFASCTSQKSFLEKGKTYANFRGFEPIDPIEYDNKVQLVENNELIEKEIKLLKPDEILGFLNNETVIVAIGQVMAEGGITYLPVTFSTRNSSYKVTMDYMKYATLGQKDENGEFIGFKRVGVGLRLISLITTMEAGINIGDLSSIGLAAKTGKLSGTMMIEVVGIKSKDVTTLLPLPSEINQTSIQNAMQALAAIKSKIYDEDTKLYPQVMAIKVNEYAYTAPITTSGTKVKNPDPVLQKADSIKIDNRIKLQVENRSVVTLSKEESAGRLEAEAFQYLFDREVDMAIETFQQCEDAYPKYHNVYEIGRLLKGNKKELSDKNSAKWREVYDKILKDYSWGLSGEIKERLKR